jgi:cobalt-zinc-cadmium resistance protein CzcA
VRSISLNDAIRTALDSNLSVRSAGYSVEAMRALKGTGFDLPKTDIEGQYGQFNSINNDNSFTVSQSFAFPSVYINRSRLNSANVKSREFQLGVARLEIATQVKQVYCQYVYLAEKKKLLTYQDSLYSGFLRAAELRAKAGETNKLEMMTARSQSLEVKNQLFQVSSDLVIFSRKLMLLLNSSVLVKPSESELHRIISNSDSANVSGQNNPMLGYMRQQSEVSRIEKKLERSQMLPDLKIGYFTQTIIGAQDVDGVSRNFDNGYRFTGLQAGISVPIWFPPFTARAKAAKINETVAMTDAAEYARQTEGNYRNLLDALSKYTSTVGYYETQAVPEADIIVDQASRSYKAGALDYLEYVLTLNRALAVRQNYLDAINNYNQTIISIDYITGKIF